MKYRIEVSVVKAGRHVIAVERDTHGEGETVEILSVEIHGSKFRVSSEDYKDGKASIVDSAGLLEWFKWARVGKTRMESMLGLLSRRTASDTVLTVTGKVRKQARIINALRVGRTFRSIADEHGISENAVIDQLRLLDEGQIAEWYICATSAKHAVRSKTEQQLLEAVSF